MSINEINPAQILSFGVIGLGFLLALLSFWLLQKEQGKKTPNARILKSIYIYMIFSFFLCSLGLASEILRDPHSQESNKKETFRQILDRKRAEIASASEPEIYKRGEMASPATAGLNINMPGGSCKKYLIIVEPENEVGVTWWSNGDGARELKVSEYGEDWFKAGEICTADDKNKSAEVGLQAKMIRGSGPYAIEVYFVSQILFDYNPE